MKILAILLSFFLASPAFASGRLFASASSQSATSSTAIATAAPLTMFACVRRTNTGVSGTVMAVSDSGNQNSFRMRINLNDDPIAMVTAASSDGSAVISGTVSSGVWQRVTVVFTSATSRTVYWNGSTANDTTNLTPGSIDRTSIAAIVGGEFFNGDIAWAFFWNAALTAAEASALESGAHPMRIRPISRVAAYPFWGFQSPEPNITAATSALTLNNTPVASTGGCPMPLMSGQ